MTKADRQAREEAEKAHREAELRDSVLAAEADRKKARRFFWGWLAAATLATVVGNGASPWVTDRPSPTVVAVVTTVVTLIPPMVAFVGIHGILTLGRVGRVHRAGGGPNLRDAGWLYLISVFTIATVAVIAAVQSYAELLALAEIGRGRGIIAPALPLTVDAGILVSSLALVVLRPASDADVRAHREAAHTTTPDVRTEQAGSARATSSDAQSDASNVNPATTTVTTPDASNVKRASTPDARAGVATSAYAQRAHRQRARARTDNALARAPEPTDEHRERAHALVAARSTTADAGAVAHALALADAGASRTDIERATGIKRDAVRRLVQADRALDGEVEPAADERRLTSVG